MLVDTVQGTVWAALVGRLYGPYRPVYRDLGVASGGA
jgi:hypothetical protein